MVGKKSSLGLFSGPLDDPEFGVMPSAQVTRGILSRSKASSTFLLSRERIGRSLWRVSRIREVAKKSSLALSGSR
jgi:hypothetical protein